MKTKKIEHKLRCLMILLLGFLLVPGAIGYGQYDDEVDGPGVFLYKHADFRGQRIFVRAGENIRNLRRRGWNDKISSIELVDGARIMIFEHANYQGASTRIKRDVIDLAEFSRGIPGTWNDKISSIKVLHGRRNRYDDEEGLEDANCIFYKHADLRGKAMRARIGRHKSIKRGMNDEISSIWIRRGYKITLFAHGRFVGKRLVLIGKGRRGTAYNLIDYGFNDILSSYKLERVRRRRRY